MDRQTLITAMGNTYISDEECAAFNAAMVQADCTNVNRAAMWCAQIGHESAGLKYYEELASGSAYEWRQDLGNVYAGDGVRYKGRSWIQVTGRHNYSVLSQWAFRNGYCSTPTFFVDHPEALTEIRYAALGSVWYWATQRPLNDLSDRRDLDGATRAINGGLNGIGDRRNRYNRCLALGEALLPDEEFGMAGEAQDVQTQLRGPELKGWEQLGGKSLVDAVADVRDQLGGPNHNWGGWPQLGNRTLVDAVGKILDVQEQILAILKAGK